jgi:hypothetical protein
MTEYRRIKRLEEDNCSNVPKRTKLNDERHREYRGTHKNLFVENMRDYRQRNLQEIKLLGNGNFFFSLDTYYVIHS